MHYLKTLLTALLLSITIGVQAQNFQDFVALFEQLQAPKTWTTEDIKQWAAKSSDVPAHLKSIFFRPCRGDSQSVSAFGAVSSKAIRSSSCSAVLRKRMTLLKIEKYTFICFVLIAPKHNA